MDKTADQTEDQRAPLITTRKPPLNTKARLTKITTIRVVFLPSWVITIVVVKMSMTVIVENIVCFS